MHHPHRDVCFPAQVAAAVAELSWPPHRSFKANPAAAREIFLPDATPCLDDAAVRPQDRDVALFLLDDVRMETGDPAAR